MSKILSIIVACYNKWNFTKSCLEDLKKLPLDHEIIIIDNNSTDETNKMLYENKRIVYHRNNENIFHSKACNQGFKKALGENILFFNNDIKIKSNYNNWTKVIVDACNSTKGLVGPTMGLLDNNLNFVKESNQQLTGNSYLGGWCVAANKNIWTKLDLDNKGQIWNEKFPFYFNDADLSFRARKKNIPLTVISLPEIGHFGKISAAQLNINKLYNEGRDIFVKKWSK